VRDNVIFGLPFREARYRATLEACSLVSDLEILEDGDSTEIGEKVRFFSLPRTLSLRRTSPSDAVHSRSQGINLSGCVSRSLCLHSPRACS